MISLVIAPAAAAPLAALRCGRRGLVTSPWVLLQRLASGPRRRTPRSAGRGENNDGRPWQHVNHGGNITQARVRVDVEGWADLNVSTTHIAAC